MPHAPANRRRPPSSTRRRSGVGSVPLSPATANLPERVDICIHYNGGRPHYHRNISREFLSRLDEWTTKHRADVVWYVIT